MPLRGSGREGVWEGDFDRGRKREGGRGEGGGQREGGRDSERGGGTGRGKKMPWMVPPVPFFVQPGSFGPLKGLSPLLDD